MKSKLLIASVAVMVIALVAGFGTVFAKDKPNPEKGMPFKVGKNLAQNNPQFLMVCTTDVPKSYCELKVKTEGTPERKTIQTWYFGDGPIPMDPGDSIIIIEN